MMNLRRFGQLPLSTLLLVLSLSVWSGCAEEAEPADRAVDGADGEGDGDKPTGSEDDDADDESSDDEPRKDAGRAAAKPDAGTSSAGRVDASRPVVRADASTGGADAGGNETRPDAASSNQLPSDGGADSGSGGTREDLGKGDGKDVITIGDSWMLLFTSGIQESLTRVSGQPYRKYARPGTRLLDDVIPGQYRSAKAADSDIKTVVMTAGGNDVIQNATIEADCKQGGAMCDAQVEKIRTALSNLWKQMSADGVQDVIHVMYSVSAGSGVKNRDAHGVKMAEACAAVPAPLRCHLLNTDALIGPGDMRADGIHPTDPGYDKIGKAVFELMQAEGMRR